MPKLRLTEKEFAELLGAPQPTAKPPKSTQKDTTAETLRHDLQRAKIETEKAKAERLRAQTAKARTPPPPSFASAFPLFAFTAAALASAVLDIIIFAVSVLAWK